MGMLRKLGGIEPSLVAYLYFANKRGQVLSTRKPLAIVKVKHVPGMVGPGRTQPLPLVRIFSPFFRLIIGIYIYFFFVRVSDPSWSRYRNEPSLWRNKRGARDIIHVRLNFRAFINIRFMEFVVFELDIVSEIAGGMHFTKKSRDFSRHPLGKYFKK